MSSVTVSYQTHDVTATAGQDYRATAGTVTLPPGTTSVNVAVDVFGDTLFEDDETFEVNLSDAKFDGLTDITRVVIGDPQANGGWAVRTFIKPFANWIWAGAIIMALGGILSLTDRRFRVAAGARKTPAGAVSTIS